MCAVCQSLRGFIVAVTALTLLGGAVSAVATEIDKKIALAINGKGQVVPMTVQNQKAVHNSPRDSDPYRKSVVQVAPAFNPDAFADALQLEKHLDQASRDYWNKQLNSSR